MKRLLTIALLIIGMAATAQQAPVKCKGTTVAGNPCKMVGSADGYCRLHNPSREHCAGTNAKKKPCGLAPLKGTKYCRYHGN